MKTKLLLIITIFLCTWGVYSATTDKAPLVLQLKHGNKGYPEYYYLQKPKTIGEDEVKYDHDIWYQNHAGKIPNVIMLSKLGYEEYNGETKKWVLTEKRDMKKEKPSVFSRFDHPDNQAFAFPTEKNTVEHWKSGNNPRGKDSYEVTSFIPAISNITSSAELKRHVHFIAQNTKTGVTEYVQKKLDEKIKFQSLCRKYSTINILLKETAKKEELDKELLQFKEMWYPTENTLPSQYQQEVEKITKTFDTRDDCKSEFQSLCRKYSKINVLLNVTTKQETFDKELLQFKKTWNIDENKTLPLLYQQEVDRITKTFNTRIYWRTGITVVFILIVVCIVVCILCPKQVETTDDMTNNESYTYDEENPAPILRTSNTDSETVHPITPVIFRTVSSTVSSHNFVSSEKKIDHPTSIKTTNSLQLEEKVSNDIVTQQETDTKTLHLFKEIIDTDTIENTNLLHVEKKVSNDIITQQETDTDIHNNPNSLKSADEKKVSYGIATQQGKDTKALLLSEEVDAEKKVSNDIVTKQDKNTDAVLVLLSEKIVHTDTDENTNSLHPEEKVSNNIVTQQKTNTDIPDSPTSFESAEEKKVSNDIVTQQEKDTHAVLVLLSEKIVTTDTDENTNSVHVEEKASNDIVTQQKTDTDTNKNTKPLKSAEKISVESTKSEKLPMTNTVTEEKTQKT